MDEKEKEFEERLANEIHTRTCAEQETTIPVEGISVGEEVCDFSEVSSKSRSTVIEQMKLIPGRKINCHIYISTVLFPEIKFIDDAIFKESPKILEEAMNRMGIEGEIEKLQHSEDTRREIKHCLAHRRSYCKDQQVKKYKGTIKPSKLAEHSTTRKQTNTFNILSFKSLKKLGAPIMSTCQAKRLGLQVTTSRRFE